MKILKGGATGLATTLTVALMVALMPAADAAKPAASSTVTSAVTASAPAQAAGKAPAGTLTSKVRGDFGRSGVVRGSFDPARFVKKRGAVYAVGTLHAVARRGDGRLVGKVDRQISIPVRNARNDGAQAAKRCPVLDLVLGPLDLDLLGLQVHLNKVVLNIVAVSGAGNLLGNLLCAVAGLLDGGSLLDLLKLSNVLNRILSALKL